MAKKYPIKPPVAVREIYEEGCVHCGGNGQEPGLEDLTCRECFGRGRRRWRVDECDQCRGSGRNSKWLGLTRCNACNGKGWNMREVG